MVRKNKHGRRTGCWTSGNDKRTRRTKRSCKDIRLAVRRGEKKKKRLSVQHMTSIFWRKTAYTAKEIKKNMVKRKNDDVHFFIHSLHQVWGGVWLASCLWRESVGWGCFCLIRRQVVSTYFFPCFFISFINWSVSASKRKRILTVINYEALRYYWMTTTCFAQELLQSRTFTFSIALFQTANIQESNDAC